MAAEDWIPGNDPWDFDDYDEDQDFNFQEENKEHGEYRYTPYRHRGVRKRPRIGILYAMTIHETDRAWLVRVGSYEEWLPKSQCSRILGDPEDAFEIPEWLVNRKGLDTYVDYE